MTPQGVAGIVGFPDRELFGWFDLPGEGGA